MATTNTATGSSEVFSANATLNGGNPAAATTSQGSTTSPEEIAWYFVESYYTTLNRTPERLHLFHQKKSSFIWGTEGDNVPVSQGRNEILERIKDLKFKDCKVRVTNVDSQTSLASGILVQVLGDMTNNAEPSKRFAQTFFLAEQTNPQGYYVLNDIFRYLRDEEEEEVLEPPVEEPVPEAAPEPVAEEVVVPEEKEPEAEVDPEPEVPAPAPAVEEEEETKEEVPVEEPEKVEEPVAEPEVEKTEEPAAAPVVPVVPAVPAVPAVPVAQPEPTEPEPTTQPVAEPTKTENQPPAPAPAPAPAPQEPPKPVKPASWAALLAPKTAPAAAPAPAQQAAAPAPAPVTTTPATPTAPTTPSTQANNNNSGWQTTESRRQNRPVSISGAPEAQASAYVRSTTGRITVTQEQLKTALSVYGSIRRVDIVNEKKHAFVDFDEPSSLQAAAGANPHRIGDQTIFVEERRPPRPSNYTGPPRGGSSFRGGERQGSRGAQRGPGDRDRFDSSRNSIGGGRGQGGNIRGGGGQFQRGGRGMGAGAASSN
ncbi:hypothetical protein TWF696_004366 [Orbilia brochopaga]|uniref:Uncharacterized protein n=1 Tax=Orbilia brochopaga TaxID=3140254 RepID=A0AAV9V614_9PEZI